MTSTKRDDDLTRVVDLTTVPALQRVGQMLCRKWRISGNPTRNVGFGCALGAALAFIPSRASAQTNPAAEALFNSGREAMAKGDYEHACQELRESNRLEPAVGAQFNLADCEEKRGKLATAWTLFRAVQQRVPEGDERASVAKERAQALEGRLPKVTLHLASGAPKNTSVRDGDIELGAGSFGIPLPMDPGGHDFVVSAFGRSSRNVHVWLAESESLEVDVNPGEMGSGSSVMTKPGTTTPGPPTLALVAFGVGGAGLTLGVIAGLIAGGKHSSLSDVCDNNAGSCPPTHSDDLDSFHTWRTVSTVGYLVGVVGVAGGAVLWVTAPKAQSATIARVWLGPVSAGVAGSF